jgi:HAD superfamily hydrolase (TIGR01509 family)
VGIEAVLTDLGGVWLRDGDFSTRERWAAAHGTTANALFDAYIDAIGPGWEGGRSEDEIHRRLVDRVGVGLGELPGLLCALHAHETLDPVLTEFFNGLRPTRSVGIITNAGPSARRILCDRFRLDQLADVIVVSSEEGVSKPHPKIFLRACESLAVDPERCVFLDDKERNVSGARAVGMHAIHFVGVEQAIGAINETIERT